MRIGILSDIHSNLEALNAVIESAKEQNVDEYICLGDIVGYGANPKECIDIIKGLTTKIVAGNHDYGVCGLTNISYFNDVAKKAIEWTKETITQDYIDFLKSLPLVLEYKEGLFVHSTPSYPDSWNYILSMYDAKREFKFFDQNFCFIGHSHQPVTFSINSEEEIGASIDDTLICVDSKRYIANSGSVGQPRDGNPKASYLIYDIEKKSISFSRVLYDIRKCQTKILDAGLPPFLAQRLEIGR
ncbi:metallophosphoesterase family protein [candidate division WOR-3 bacterium]|nr:metallophosphoesterase family protein [candidate division WOR-3 bacterium]